LSVKANGNKLAIVDPKATIQRYGLQGVRRPHVWPDREQGPSAVTDSISSTPSVERAGLVAARVRGIRFVDHRVGREPDNMARSGQG